MHVVLYYKDNGFGLTQDAKVINAILQQFDFNVEHRDPNNPTESDLSIHFEIPATKGLRLSKRSIFFPNFEWFFFDTAIIKEYSVVACKTRHALPIAERYSKRAVYTGFTSEDMLSVYTQRRLEFVHIAGQSRLKNTLQVLQCWADNPNFPKLHLYTHVYPPPEKLPPNVSYNFGPVDRIDIQKALNENVVAVLPSATEGFGQALWEALSTGAILITTNAEPMNEIPTPYYVDAVAVGKHNIQTVWAIKPYSLSDIVRQILKLTNPEIVVQSVNARNTWIENYNDFVKRFLEIL